MALRAIINNFNIISGFREVTRPILLKICRKNREEINKILGGGGE